MALPTPDTPLYNHPLPDIEKWLRNQGCIQDQAELHCWQVDRAEWAADLELDTEVINVRYTPHDRRGEPPIQRSFKYSLSRQDLENAIFSGP